MPLLCPLSLRPIMILSHQSFMLCCAFQPVKTVYLPLQRNFPRNFMPKKYFHASLTKKLETATEQNGSSDSSSSSSDENDDNEGWKKEEELDAKILEAALPFVKEHGWATDAIARGAESLGYSGMVHGMFERGGTDLVNYFYSNCNSHLEVELQSLLKEQEDGKKKRTTEFICRAVELRLRMNAEFIDSWAKALVLHAAPTNFSEAFNNFGTLIDTIWHYAGDKSTDFNWYTKRAVLAAVYKSTELCMLQDTSEDLQDTWAFLERRLKDVEGAANFVKQTNQRTKDVSDVFQVGFITMQNILGLNTKYRR